MSEALAESPRPQARGARALVAGASEPFASLHLSASVLRGVEATGLGRMTALQADVVARGRFGLDVLVHGPARSVKMVAAVVLSA